MPARLKRLEDVLRARVSKSSGGWPHWLHIDRASTSLVGTAHTLAMLRMLGYEAHDELVTDGMRYLAREVTEQVKPGARGVYARYPAYALWGLMRFPGAVFDPEIFNGAKFSATWLIGKQRPSGGWTVDGARNDATPISLPATMAAVHGLDRLAPCARGVIGRRYADTSAKAREAVAAVAELDGGHAFWRQRPGGTPCPGATSLAVLTLAGGSSRHRELARQGLEHLRAGHKDWTTAVHVDDQLEQLTWRIMSFSLGLRALLHPCATKAPRKQIIQEVVGHFDNLWDEDTGAWAVQQGHDASTTGSYAVLAAVRALKNHWIFDPAAEYGVARTAPARQRPAEPSELAGELGSRRQVRMVPEKQLIYIDDPELSDRAFMVGWEPRAKSQWGILEALLRLKLAAGKSRRLDQYEYTLSPEELAIYAKSETVNPDTVDRTVRRINEKIAEAATENRIYGFPGLIEKIIPGDSSEVRYGIEEAKVVIAVASEAPALGQLA